MTSYSASSADMNVVNAAYATASKLTNDPVVLMSLFEAAMVESNFHNVNHGDRDSLGYLQQRPSQGWPNPTDIPTATKSFISRAVANRRDHPSITPGQLAQSVQRSAYPDRYNQAQGAAAALLEAAKKHNGGTGFDPAGLISGAAGLVASANPIDAVANAIRNAASPLVSAGKVADQVYKVFMPSNFLRIASGVAGSMCLLFGIYLLTKEVRNG